MLAGHVWALIAEAEFAADFVGAVPFNERAVLISDAAAATVGYLAFLFRYAVAVGEVGFADAAVHAAGRDLFRGKLVLGHAFVSVEEG